MAKNIVTCRPEDDLERSSTACARTKFVGCRSSTLADREIAWQTEPDSLIQHAGTLKFHDNGDGTTTMHLKMTYNPLAGVIGHGMARLVGSDLKTMLEEDVLRIKTVLDEAVIPRADVQQRTS